MSDNCNSRGLVTCALIIGLSLILTSKVISGSIERIRTANQTISVKGYAEKPIRSNLVTWSSAFGTNATDITSGYERLENDLAKIILYLHSQKIPADNISVKPISINTLYRKDKNGNRTNQISGYHMSRQVSVKSSDVELIKRVSSDSSELLKKGIGFSSYAPQYYYTKLNELKVSMLKEATANAKQRAIAIAEAAGNNIEAITSARQGVFQITPIHSTEISDYGMNDTSSIEKMVKAVVTVKFSVE